MTNDKKKKVLDAVLGKKGSLNGLIDYADDAVVSKTLLDKGTGTVTLFAFAKGQALSEHSAPFDALVQIVDGQGVIIIDGEEHEVAAGEVIIMPADVPHAVKAEQKFKMLLTMIRA
ncbi:hypothetical protein STSP2_02662 [Anaerohalosphaera lusitana]|uniref:Cupin type-2 domain-containing protein n=1 Tax=Anaerohalosphaera lusitana TaxID=1936003 RepID=A0A1U9NNH4_9BACT|nr:cupin domain-containing protein [Anaerohalosphaera lusitana]AQT69471.1 hypothetical protein STSP2_02662 [Anaerohalosphaera lusitana]